MSYVYDLALEIFSIWNSLFSDKHLLYILIEYNTKQSWSFLVCNLAILYNRQVLPRSLLTQSNKDLFVASHANF